MRNYVGNYVVTYVVGILYDAETQHNIYDS
jgi:hypothetical protein